MRKLAIAPILIFILLLSGCGTITAHQKIYRDGTFDLSIDIKSDNEMFINMAKEGFEESPIIEKATLIELDDGFRYVLERASFSDISTEEGNSIFESVGIKKEFKFPYYYYTITLESTGMEDSEYGSMGMALDYVIEPFGKITDTNGIYLGEDKKEVKFNLIKSKEYYVTFKDSFLASWLGGASKIVNRNPQEAEVALNSPETETTNQENDIEPETTTPQNDEIAMNTQESVEQVNVEPTPKSNDDITSIIKEYCAKKWPKDFSMRAYCEEQQIEGYNDLLETAPSGMSNSDFQVIKTMCEDKWETDFNMRAYCEEQQVEGYNDLMNTKPTGMTDKEFQMIKTECEQQWSDDFNMRSYCEEQQVEGYEELLKTKPAGMSDSDYQMIKSECEDTWPDDFNMRAYCEEQQVDGWMAVQ